MKKILFVLFIIPCLSISQVQIGQDIYGENINDQFGFSVSLNSDGSIVAISSTKNDINGIDSGYVRVFENQSGVWNQVGQSIEGEGDYYYSGNNISLSSDGTMIAISSVGSNSFTGSVRIYENLSGVWTKIGQDILGEGFSDRFGEALEISSDGTKIAIGAINNDGNGSSSGHVRVFENQSGNWIQIGNDIDGDGINDQIGIDLDMSLDGNIIAIGSYSDHVRVYENILGVWTQIGNDIDGESIGDDFGWYVSLNSIGNIIAIGAPKNDGNGLDSGHVRLYENLSGVWTQIGNDINGEAAGDYFGYNVDLSSSGNIVIASAILNDGNGNNSGHTRIYKNINSVWTQIGQDIDGDAADDLSGIGISISSDETTIAIGAYGNDGNGSFSGQAKIFDITGITLTLTKFKLDNISIHPNPTSKILNIALENPSEFNKITIYNNLGQLITEETKTKINVSNYSKGIYFAEIETSKGKITKKFIVE